MKISVRRENWSAKPICPPLFAILLQSRPWLKLELVANAGRVKKKNRNFSRISNAKSHVHIRAHRE